MKRWSLGLAALLVAVLTVAASASPPIYTEEVTDFGRNRWRTHYAPTEPEYPLTKESRAVWEVPLGLSRSQPLVVRRELGPGGKAQTRIYHVAGDRLWALNGDVTPRPMQPGQSGESYRQQLRAEGFILWDTPVERLCTGAGLAAQDELLAMKCGAVGARQEQRPFASSQAAYWRGATPDDDVLYVGFGHPASLVALRARDGKMLGGYIVDAGTDRGIVGAPLVFPGDMAVIGTTSGEAFIIRGLASGTASARGLAIGGRISFSPVPVGESGFIIASDARWTADLGTHGYLMAYNLKSSVGRDFSARWPAAVVTPAGVPGEAAIDARTVYFADKYGKLYALSIETGELLWCRQYPGLGPCQDGEAPQPAFINNGPGVDDTRVYFVFRNREGPNQGAGAVVALNKGTGEPAWQRPMEFPGNTAPVPMGHIVIVGDTGGYVRAYDKATGKPVSYGGYPLRLSSEPYQSGAQGERWWEPIGGTATQMTVAAGLMLVGVNSQTEERTLLKAYKLHRLPDLTLEYLDVPASATPDGFAATVHAICRNCDDPITTTVSLTVSGRALPRQVVTFRADQNWGATLTWASSGPLPPGQTTLVIAMVDPDDAVEESDETNNSLRALVPITSGAAGAQDDDGWGSKLSN